MKKGTDQYWWNALFAVLFLVVAILLFKLVGGHRFEVRWLYYITSFDLVVLSLAVFRSIRLISYDKITSFVRVWFMHDDCTPKYQTGPMRTIAELLDCMWCTGVWAAPFLMVLYFGSTFGRFLVIILAISAVGSFLQNLSRLVANKAGH